MKAKAAKKRRRKASPSHSELYEPSVANMLLGETNS